MENNICTVWAIHTTCFCVYKQKMQGILCITCMTAREVQQYPLL